MGILRWLFGQNIASPRSEAQPEFPASWQQPAAQFPVQTRTFTLVEGSFDPDGEASDLMWYGFHIRDESDTAVPYWRAAREFGLHIFKVAGLTYRAEVAQRDEFKPGEIVSLRPEYDNEHDRNAVSVWDRSGTLMVGYVPRDRARTIRSALSNGETAMAIAEHRKDGRRVSITVMIAPMNVKG